MNTDFKRGYKEGLLAVFALIRASPRIAYATKRHLETEILNLVKEEFENWKSQ
jgi:hypothetical protein